MLVAALGITVVCALIACFTDGSAGDRIGFFILTSGVFVVPMTLHSLGFNLNF